VNINIIFWSNSTRESNPGFSMKRRKLQPLHKRIGQCSASLTSLLDFFIIQNVNLIMSDRILVFDIRPKLLRQIYSEKTTGWSRSKFYHKTNAAFSLNGFDNQERNLIFVKTDFEALKLKFHACNFKVFHPLRKLYIAWPW